MTDDQLMLRLALGDKTCLEELDRRYRDDLVAYFTRRRLDQHRAEDLVQDIWVRVLRAAERYEARGRFRAYLFTIAQNLFRDEIGRDKRHPDSHPDLDWIASSPGVRPARLP